MQIHDDRIYVRAPGSMVAELDDVIARRRVSRPHEAHSRNSVMREALAALLDREASTPAVRVRQRSAATN